MIHGNALENGPMKPTYANTSPTERGAPIGPIYEEATTPETEHPGPLPGEATLPEATHSDVGATVPRSDPLYDETTPPESRRLTPTYAEATPPQVRHPSPLYEEATPPQVRHPGPMYAEATLPQMKHPGPMYAEATPPQVRHPAPLYEEATPPPRRRVHTGPAYEDLQLPSEMKSHTDPVQRDASDSQSRKTTSPVYEEPFLPSDSLLLSTDVDDLLHNRRSAAPDLPPQNLTEEDFRDLDLPTAEPPDIPPQRFKSNSFPELTSVSHSQCFSMCLENDAILWNSFPTCFCGAAFEGFLQRLLGWYILKSTENFAYGCSTASDV